MILAYWIITVLLYVVGLIVAVAGGWLMFEEEAAPEEWRLWRGGILIGLVGLWAWPLVIVVAIPWLAFKWCRDAFFTLRVMIKGFPDEEV